MATGYTSPTHVEDFISGVLVRATPEEVEAVQIMARRLVEDLGYPKTHIQTRPQFRVRRSPSDDAKSFPVDIAVFSGEAHHEDAAYIVVECKKRHRKEGVAQLKRYLDLCAATIGAWFNGDEHEYLRKLHHRNGTVSYESIPSLPRFGQRIEDIGRFRRRDLRQPHNLKAVFRDIRNHLAGMTTGITRDESLAQEIINLLFCKIYDEQETAQDQIVSFRAGFGEKAGDICARVLTLMDAVKAAYTDVFSASDTLGLDPESVRYVVGELQTYCLVNADRDAIGEAFEVFIGPALRGPEGQFFTPRNVVNMMVEIVDPKPGERVIDPACGSGGFLIMALAHVWNQIRQDGERKAWTEAQILRRQGEVAGRCFFGIEKDAFLSKVTRAYMTLMGDGRTNVYCENSLLPPAEWSSAAEDRAELDSFDVVLTNPPFGQKIAVKGAALLGQYELAHRWVRDKETGAIERSNVLEARRPPQIVFLERCLQLLKPGGRLGLVLPESILGNPSYEYLFAFLRQHATVTGVVTLPEALFKTSGKGGTHTKVCALFMTKNAPRGNERIFMADVKWCGHDSRGNPTLRRKEDGTFELLDEVPAVAKSYRILTRNPTRPGSRQGFVMRTGDLRGTIMVPKYYDPAVAGELDRLAVTHDLVTLGDLQKQRVISVSTGVEVGKMAYGTGRVPFIRTSDLSNWELKADFKQGVSQDFFDEFEARGAAKAGDILIVRDGTYLIGTCAMVTDGDVPMLFQSHLFRLRVLRPKVMNPWLLFGALNMPIVKRQFRAKQFTQDIIDTVGRRLFEIAIPVSKAADERQRIAAEVRKIIQTRAAMRERSKQLVLEVEGIQTPNEEELEALEAL